MNNVWPTLAQMSECLCLELAKPDADGEVEDVCFCGVVAGDAVLMEYVTDAGVMGWVRLNASYPSSVFPSPDDGSVICTIAPLAHEIEVGVARCAPIANGERLAPSEEQWALLAQQQAGDVQRLLRAVVCCLRPTDLRWTVGSFGVSGPQGGVLSTATTVYVTDY